MLQIYCILLKIYGLKNILNPIKHDNNISSTIINIDDNDNINEHIVEKRNSIFKSLYFRIPINNIYKLFVLCNILWPFIMSIIYASIYTNIQYFTANLFILLFIVQYIVGVQYYSTEHFYITNKKNEYYSKYILIIMLMSLLISIIIILVFVFLIVFGINMNIYSDIYENSGTTGKVFIIIALVIHIFYSYNAILSNVIIFSNTFIIYYLKIKGYKKKLKLFIASEDIEDELYVKTQGIYDIITRYSVLKEEHTKSVNSMNNIFSTITIFGVIASYFIIINYSSGFVGINTYIDFGIYIIAQVIYIFIISRIRLIQSSIISSVNSPIFIQKYLCHTKFLSFDVEKKINCPVNETCNKVLHNDIENDDDTELNDTVAIIRDVGLRTFLRSNENTQNTQFIILSNKLTAQWENFKILGFDINDTQLLYKLIGVITIFLMVFNVYESIGYQTVII